MVRIYRVQTTSPLHTLYMIQPLSRYECSTLMLMLMMMLICRRKWKIEIQTQKTQNILECISLACCETKWLLLQFISSSTSSRHDDLCVKLRGSYWLYIRGEFFADSLFFHHLSVIQLVFALVFFFISEQNCDVQLLDFHINRK